MVCERLLIRFFNDFERSDLISADCVAQRFCFWSAYRP